MNSKLVRIITHNGKFHADDVCGIAALDILHSGKIEVVRTRDPEIIETGDVVLDVGGRNDGEKFFDHHQQEGGGVRQNGIPYASFGLIWKKFGSKICGGDEELADEFDSLFVQPIDAEDNGVDVFKVTVPGVMPVTLGFLPVAINPTWKEGEETQEEKFRECLELYKKIILRFLSMQKDERAARALVEKAYESSKDKRIIILDENYPYHRILAKHPEPLFVVYPKKSENTWHVTAVKKEESGFESRIYFPAGWAGRMKGDLAKASGVPDALFCHNKLFFATAKSREGAIALAMLAINHD